MVTTDTTQLHQKYNHFVVVLVVVVVVVVVRLLAIVFG